MFVLYNTIILCCKLKVLFESFIIYSAGNYYPGSGTIQNNIEPPLYQYNADFFLNGHDHNLQHLKKSDGTGPEICIIGKILE